MTTVAVDAMGGDRAPAEIVAGAAEAAAGGVDVVLTGAAAAVEAELERCGARGRVEVVDAPDVIGFHDEPAAAVRARPDSSMVRACRLVRVGRAGAVVSAGSTGAMLAACLLHIGRTPGVHRPGIAVVRPARGGPCVLIDAGANSEARPEHLRQFGLLGTGFAREVLGVSAPRVGLLSIGEEATKGNQLTLEAHALLAAEPGVDFAGNCEGRDVLVGDVQVVVADGFTGNVLLKGLEGAATSIFTQVRAAAASSTRARIGGLLLRPALRAVRDRTDPDTYGGAYLLGVRGLAVITHGNAGRRAVANAIRYAARGAAAPGTDLQPLPATNTVPGVVSPDNGDPSA